MPNRIYRVFCPLCICLTLPPIPSLAQESPRNPPSESLLTLDAAKKALAHPNADVKKSAFDSLRALARSGNASAMLAVGKCYLDGEGVAKDPKLAYLAYLKAAEADSTEAMYQVAHCLQDGIGISKNAPSGMSWLKKAAEHNHLRAIAEIAEDLFGKYDRNHSLGPSIKKWSEKGALLEIPECQRIFGVCHEFGINMPANPQLAFSWYSKAAKNGDARAAVIVALCHLEGVGTLVDENRGLLLLKDAATNSNPHAIYHYAINLDNLVVAQRAKSFLDPLGFGERSLSAKAVNADYKREVVIQLKRAVDLEHVESMNELAMKYSRGDGCEKDPDAAFELASQSESTGNLLGISMLADCIAQGIGTKINPRRAVTLYAKAAKLGSPIAQYKYGLCFASGFGVPTNMAACNQWMTTSASNGCQDASVFLERVAENQRRAATEWLNSMVERNWATDMLDQRRDEYHRDQADHSSKMADRDRMNAP